MGGLEQLGAVILCYLGVGLTEGIPNTSLIVVLPCLYLLPEQRAYIFQRGVKYLHGRLTSHAYFKCPCTETRLTLPKP